MKAIDLKTKTYSELIDHLFDLKKEMFNLRFQQKSGELENTARIRLVRRDVARVQTFLNRKKMENAHA